MLLHHHHLKQLLHRRTTVVNVRRNLDERLLKKMEHLLSLGGPSPTIPGSFSAHRQQANDRISSLFLDRCHQTPADEKHYRKKQLTRIKIRIFLPYYLRRKKTAFSTQKKILQASRADKKLAKMGTEKPLEPPKNGILFLDLIRVAYEVLDAWKFFIK